VHERLTQLLRVGASFTIGFGQRARRAVMLHHIGVLDRQIRHALVEAFDRVTARQHHRLDQFVCVGHGL